MSSKRQSEFSDEIFYRSTYSDPFVNSYPSRHSFPANAYEDVYTVIPDEPRHSWDEYSIGTSTEAAKTCDAKLTTNFNPPKKAPMQRSVDPAPSVKAFTRDNKGSICSRCGKRVYFAEEMRAAGQSFHKSCYKCSRCNRNINGGSYSVHNGLIFDNNCYKRCFAPKGVGFGIGAGALSTST